VGQFLLSIHALLLTLVGHWDLEDQASPVFQRVLAHLMALLVPYHLVYQQYLKALLFLVLPQDLVLQQVQEVQEVLPHQ